MRRSVARSFRCEALSTQSQGGDGSRAGRGFQFGVAVPYCSPISLLLMVRVFFGFLPFYKHYKLILYNRLSPSVWIVFSLEGVGSTSTSIIFRSFVIRACLM